MLVVTCDCVTVYHKLPQPTACCTAVLKVSCLVGGILQLARHYSVAVIPLTHVLSSCVVLSCCPMRCAILSMQRGVQLVATAHGNELQNLVKNPALSDLIGGIQSVTLGEKGVDNRVLTG